MVETLRELGFDHSDEKKGGAGGDHVGDDDTSCIHVDSFGLVCSPYFPASYKPPLYAGCKMFWAHRPDYPGPPARTRVGTSGGCPTSGAGSATIFPTTRTPSNYSPGWRRVR